MTIIYNQLVGAVRGMESAMPDQDKREWPTFADILSELDSLGGSRATTRLSAPEPAIVASTDTSTLPTELAPSQFDASVLDSPSEQSEPLFEMSALSTLEPSPDVRTTDPTPEGPTENDWVELLPSAAVPVAEGPSESLNKPDQTANVPLADSGLIDWSNTALADDAKLSPQPEIDWTILAPEWDAAAATETQASQENFDVDPATEPDEFESGAVFPFDPHLHAAPGSSESVDSSPATGFSATEWSSTTQEPHDMAPAPEPPAIDSIATANAIESDLQDIFALDQADDESNVIPLHGSSEDHSEAVVGLDSVFDPETDEEALQEWVGIDPQSSAAEDPWAHMRPAEDEEAKGGFWSGRSKLFGGADRKAQKEARREAERAKESLESDYEGPECPECGSPGQVDLDDPVGGKLHLSCGSCENVWSQPIEAGEERKGA